MLLLKAERAVIFHDPGTPADLARLDAEKFRGVYLEGGVMAPWIDAPVLLALPVGIAFGLLLERGGLASARTIADQLTLRDFTVVKVMLSAIVTAMLGLFWAERLGWLDLSRVAGRGQAQTVHYLRYKVELEERLNRALRDG